MAGAHCELRNDVSFQFIDVCTRRLFRMKVMWY